MKPSRRAWVAACALGVSAGCGGGSGSSSPPPSAPLHVAASAGDRVVTIRWDAVAGAEAYTVYWANASGVSKANGSVLRTSAVALSHTGLTNGATYYYVVTATSAAGESAESAEVSATPLPSQYSLAIGKVGSGSGTVVSTPAAIDCGSTCSASVPTGTIVSLTATPDTTSTFDGWTGACTGISATCTLTMDDARSVTATFTHIDHALTVSRAGTGGGEVASFPAMIDCGSSCSASVPAGTIVILTATPDAASIFDGWSGDCEGTNLTCTLTVDAARAATATFTRITHALTVSLSGTGGGAVASSPQGIDCGPTCTATFDDATAVTLTATPDATSTFAGWTGACTGADPTCQVTVGAAKEVTAVFTRIAYALSVGRAGTGGGSVGSSPAGIDCGSTCTASFVTGRAVTLTATPDATSIFAGWTGACSGTSPTCSVTMDAAKSVTAAFGVELAWIGPTDGDWHEPSNWSRAQVPTSNDAVFIDADVVVHASSGITFQELTLGDASGSSSPSLVLGAGTEGPPGSLTIYDRATLTQNTTAQILLASVAVHAGGLINHSANLAARDFVVNIQTTGDFTLEEGASIDLDGLGYAGGPPPVNPGTNPGSWTILPGYGPGGGGVMYSGFYGGGAGHGGQGVVIPIYSWAVPPSGGGAPYDSETDPTDPGSGGGTGGGSSFGPCQAGAGGGAAILVVGGNLQLDGVITADGADKTGNWPCGGGAGGTINLTAASAAGAGTLSADGGFGYGSGAGGRIAAKVSGAIRATWAVSVSGLSSPYGTSQDGTTYFPNWPLSRIRLTPSAATLPAGTQQQFTAAGVHGAGASQPLTATDGLVWGVDDTSIATIDASGLLTAVACGETRVTASVGEVVGSAPLKVCSDVYVSTSGDDTSGDGSAGNPYRTITFALSRAWPANTVVHLAPGTYSAGETFPLRPADGVTLSGAGSEQTTIAGNVNTNSGPPVGIVNYGSSITLPQATRIEDLTIANAGGPAIVIYFESSGTASISPVLRNNVLIGTSSGYSPGVHGAIVLLGHAYGGASVVISPTIKDNTIHGDGMPALMVYALQGATIAPTLGGNTITAVYPAYSSGAVTSIYLIGGAPRFEHNTIAATNATAMWMFSYSYSSPLSAVLLANEISWTPPRMGISAGVFLEEQQSGTGSMVFSDNTIAGATTAIQIYSDDGTGKTDLDLGGGASGSPGRNTIRGATDLDNSRNPIPLHALDDWWSDTPPTRIVAGPGVSAIPSNAQSLSFDVSPAGGPVVGGTVVTLTAQEGTFFVDDVGATHRRIAVTIGNRAATDVSVNADHRQLTAVTPAGSTGAAAVVVTNPAGQSGAASFWYESPP